MYLVRMPLGLFLHQLIYKIDFFSISFWPMKVKLYILHCTKIIKLYYVLKLINTHWTLRQMYN